MAYHKRITEQQKNALAAKLSTKWKRGGGKQLYVPRKEQFKLAREFNVGVTTVGRVWSEVRRVLLASVTAPTTPLVRKAGGMSAEEARAVLKVPSVEVVRSARADVFPTTTVARTRGSVVVIFDVNASIVDVINTVTSAWERARNGADTATYQPGEENARNGSGG